MVMQRRSFLARAGAGLVAGLLPVGSHGWAATGGGGTERLVVIFMRGAVDGLALVAPHGDPHYATLRPAIAPPPPGQPGGAIDLDGHFALHPALAPVLPLWHQGSLAFVHAAGSPDPSRSHFDAQAFMESGTPGIPTTPDGWMNRLLSVLPGPHKVNQAVSVGPTVPRILSGRMPVGSVPSGLAATRPALLDRPAIATAFDRLYSGTDALSTAYQTARESRREMSGDLEEEMRMADAGAPSAAGFAEDARRLGRMMGRDPGMQLGFLAVGGWDTHVNQAAQLTNRLKPFADGIAGLVEALGPAYRETTILVVSEFGRTVRENGNGGTDHGHGSLVWVAGGKVAGGRVHGDWPGLAEDRLYQGRDLAVTTDFRTVINTILEQQMRLTDAQLDTVLPAMPAGQGRLPGLIKA